MTRNWYSTLSNGSSQGGKDRWVGTEVRVQTKCVEKISNGLGAWAKNRQVQARPRLSQEYTSREKINNAEMKNRENYIRISQLGDR